MQIQAQQKKSKIKKKSEQHTIKKFLPGFMQSNKNMCTRLMLQLESKEEISARFTLITDQQQMSPPLRKLKH